MAAPLTLILFLQQKERENFAQCEEPSRSDSIRGNYENKIRFFSPPEKTYEIFASHKQEDGELRMTYKDFLRAMTPYCFTPFFEDTDDYLKENKIDVLTKVDADNDGTISFTEFFFFLVLLQIQPNRLKRVFKKYPEGKLSKEQASEALRTLRKGTQAGKKQQDKTKVDARAIKATEDDFKTTNLHLVEVLFKDKEIITVKDILDMQDGFREDLWNYRFHTLEPNESGKTSTENFLKTNLVSLRSPHVERYRRQIRKIAAAYEENDPGVSVHEFVALQYFFEKLDIIKAKCA